MNIPAQLPRRYAVGRKAQTPNPAAVYDAARLWGTGNPRTTGATGGEWTAIKRRNTSRFTYVGSVK